ncbi:hypothetical protein TRFO_03743 [Tritrichomonas foetus]|uniref:Right handed beta helix domain-containing protein n=1 Tax=Tritrichomonas foetus TaxID=1144522 RepID=A0A1J4KLE0_9EUKA|nr:hypothetical protein TRFO_03743 [Tritrichomonas foetus]|eukprot:OHT12113.1 hypothetical protein TRFO_03743 [Tritrichomonas foetus]
MFLIFYFLSSFSKSSENPFQPDSIEQIPSLDQFSNNRISIQSNENDLTCENGKRCKHINVRGTPLFVSVTDSTFQDIHNFDSTETDGDGGAIYIKNYYLYCEQTTFNKCSCSAQGGALFIKLDLAAFEDEINCTVVNCTFSSNEALGGGAVFAHGTTGRHFEFDKCVFQDNKSTYEGDTELPTTIQGGGAIFLNNPNGFIVDCTFIYNTGIGADITLFFGGGLQPKQGIVINNSVFYFNGYDSNPSSFYISKPYGEYSPMSVTVHNCIFTGQIKGEKSHYLDCNEDDTNPNKVLLSNVTFCESSEGQAFQGDKSKYIDENSVISYVCDQYDLPDYPIIDPPTKNEDVTSSETEYLPPTETQSESDEPDDACVSGKRC